MEKYKNKSLAKIAAYCKGKDFSNLEGIFVVPVGEICQRLGLSVEFTLLPEGTSGYYDNRHKTIYVNENYAATRNLFTIAHEIGHFILHRESKNRFDTFHQYTKIELKQEKEANDFAAELLMPQYKFEEAFKEVRGNITKLADRFGVSTRAVEMRSLCLGLIDNV